MLNKERLWYFTLFYYSNPYSDYPIYVSVEWKGKFIILLYFSFRWSHRRGPRHCVWERAHYYTKRGCCGVLFKLKGKDKLLFNIFVYNLLISVAANLNFLWLPSICLCLWITNQRGYVSAVYRCYDFFPVVSLGATFIRCLSRVKTVGCQI